METRQIHVRDLSTVTGIMQFEHEVQSIYFLGLEDFVGTIYLSMESDKYSNEAVPLTSNTFIIGQPMTIYNTTYTCQIYGVLNNGEKIQLSKRFRLIVDKSNDIQGDSEEYPVDPNFTNGIIEFMDEQKEQAQSEIEATGEAVKASIPSDYTTLSDDVNTLNSEVYGSTSSKLVQQSDDILANENFVISNGGIYAVNTARPFNSVAFDADKLTFKYRRRTASNSFYVGVAIDGHFVGAQTRQSVTAINQIYDNVNAVYSNATLITSVADSDLSTEVYNDYEATIDGQIFTLKKGDTTILSFSVADGIEIQGIAFLNLNISTFNDACDLKDVTMVQTAEVGMKGELTNLIGNVNSLSSNVSSLSQAVANADIVGTGEKYRIVAGAVRNAGSGWYFIVDGNHNANLNCSNVYTQDGYLVIQYPVDATKVVGFLIGCDETFASKGYMIGASVGKDRAFCEIYQNAPLGISGQVEVKNDGTITLSDGSVGISSVIWDSTNSRMTVNHDDLSLVSGDAPATMPIIQPRLYGFFIPRVYTMNGTKVVFDFFNPTTGTKITELSNKLSFSIVRQNMSNLKKVKIDPSTINAPTANFWYIGIFQIS